MFLPLLLASLAPIAHAQDGGLAAAWGTDAPPTEWIFVLETSLGGKPAADASRDAIARLVEVLPEGDRVEILAMHARTSPALPERTVATATRAALADEIRGLELPTAKSTDLGAGLSELLTALDGGGEDTVRIVAAVGTFCHSPPLGSTWADGGYGCRAVRNFDRLDQAFDTGTGRDRVSAVLFPTATESQPIYTPGVDTTRKLFEPTASVEVATVPFPAWVDALVAGGHAEARVRPEARAEAARLAPTLRVVTGPSSEAPRAELAVATGLEHLGFTVSSVTVTGATATNELARLAPDGTLGLAVTVPPPPFSVLPRTDTVDIPVTVTLAGTLEPADALRAAGIPPERTELAASVTLQATRSYGLSATRSAGIFVSAFLLVGAGVLVARRKVQPLRLGGTFSYRRAGEPRQALPIAHLAEAPLVVRPDGTLAVGRREEAALVLRVERPLWQSRTTVEIRVPNAEINTKPAPAGRHTIVAGATSIQFLDYRLSWE